MAQKERRTMSFRVVPPPQKERAAQHHTERPTKSTDTPTVPHAAAKSYSRQMDRQIRQTDALDWAMDRLADRAQEKGYLRPCNLGGWLVDVVGDGMRSMTKVGSREAGLLLLCRDNGGAF